MRVEQDAVTAIVRTLGPGRALDLGTGTGRNVPLLSAAGARFSVGLDLSMAMLAHNRSGAARVCANACRLPFADASFDTVCSSLMAGDVADLAALVEEVARVLQPGGRFVYSDFHPSWAAARFRRTFRTGDGRVFELPYCSHSLDDHLSSLNGARLAVKMIREPRAGAAVPIVVVFYAVKAGRLVRRS
jgi:ubiquinone/menaquinone biosynthesis C-methylase UbiE